MFLIQQVTSNPLQKQTLILEDGSALTLTLYFRPLQQGWFINELTLGTFVIRGLRVTNSPNMLHQFRNQISFGLACYSVGGREPSLQQDFSNGSSKLYILSAEEVAAYLEYLKIG